MPIGRQRSPHGAVPPSLSPHRSSRASNSRPTSAIFSGVIDGLQPGLRRPARTTLGTVGCGGASSRARARPPDPVEDRDEHIDNGFLNDTGRAAASRSRCQRDGNSSFYIGSGGTEHRARLGRSSPDALHGEGAPCSMAVLDVVSARNPPNSRFLLFHRVDRRLVSTLLGRMARQLDDVRPGRDGRMIFTGTAAATASGIQWIGARQVSRQARVSSCCRVKICHVTNDDSCRAARLCRVRSDRHGERWRQYYARRDQPGVLTDRRQPLRQLCRAGGNIWSDRATATAAGVWRSPRGAHRYHGPLSLRRGEQPGDARSPRQPRLQQP